MGTVLTDVMYHILALIVIIGGDLVDVLFDACACMPHSIASIGTHCTFFISAINGLG
jgi:hypothetical protein